MNKEEARVSLKQKVKRRWDEIADDVFEASVDHELPQATVIEVAFDQSYDRLKEELKVLSRDEVEKALREAFPYSCYC